MKAFKYRKKGHYKGICAKEDVGKDNHQWLLDVHGPGDDEHLTFANVLINANYRRYVQANGRMGSGTSRLAVIRVWALICAWPPL